MIPIGELDDGNGREKVNFINENELIGERKG